MNWRRRIAEIVIAGGTLTPATGCWHFCNASPDPCCSDSSSAECAAYNASSHNCISDGGRFYGLGGCEFPDAGAPDAGEPDGGP